MPGSPPPPRIPLPRASSHRVRSAVIHAISLAHFSLTSTRSCAVNSWNARVRLKAENDQLRVRLQPPGPGEAGAVAAKPSWLAGRQ